MSLFDKLGYKDSLVTPCLNTNTLIDVVVGSYYEMGLDGLYYLNSGLSPMTGFSGRGGCYKSTTADFIMANVLKTYPDSSCIKLDTENNSFGKERFNVMAGEDISDRIIVNKSSDVSQEEFLEKIDGIVAEKINHRKDYMVETPFRDINTGKNQMMFVPTIVGVDSFSMWRSVQEMKSLDNTVISDSSHNVDDMRDGMLKRKMLFKFSQLTSKAGIYFILTAQVGNLIKLNPMEQVTKQSQWMRQDDRLKSVSDMFTFLTNTLIQPSSPSPILASDKSAEYPSSVGNDSDINLINAKVTRCKTSGGGNIIPLVISQDRGVMGKLTNYHYLKSNGDYGLEKKGHNRYTAFKPDVILHRNKIIETLDNDYEIARALEILAQMHWVLSNWNLQRFPAPIPESIDKFYELLENNKSIKKSDILNSRGYWTYNKKDPRKYMGLVEILHLINKK